MTRTEAFKKISIEKIEKKTDENNFNRLRRIHWIPFSKKIFRNNYIVIGIDNLNSYYSKKLKKDRLNQLFERQKETLFFTKSLLII